MSNASLSITVVEQRMLKQHEAATYTGLNSKHFKIICPVQPIEIRSGCLRWDKRELDRWIDMMKEGAEATTQHNILGKL